MISDNKKTVLANISYLAILNALNIALPLVLIPYLTLTIGASHFGDYAYVLVVVQNMMMLTAYGFNFSATRQVATHRQDAAYINSLFTHIIAAKTLIALCAFALLLAGTPWLFNTPERLFMFLTAMGMVAGDILIPVWLFQGMERMKYVTICTATARIVFTLSVFVAITEAEHYKYVLALDSLGYLLAGLLSLWLAHKLFGIRLLAPTWHGTIYQLRDGFTVFCSTFFINLYRNLNIFILNFFVTPAAVGIYAVAEKIIKAAQSIVTPISQALFPHMSQRFTQHTTAENKALLRKVSLILLALTLAMAACLIVASNYLHYIVGAEFEHAKNLMFLMTPVLVFGALNYLLGFVGLVNLGQQRYFFRSVMASGIISVGFLLALAPLIGATAAAISMTLSELILFCLCAIRILKLR